jgi:hypothetical protein
MMTGASLKQRAFAYVEQLPGLLDRFVGSGKSV